MKKAMMFSFLLEIIIPSLPLLLHQVGHSLGLKDGAVGVGGARDLTKALVVEYGSDIINPPTTSFHQRLRHVPDPWSRHTGTGTARWMTAATSAPWPFRFLTLAHGSRAFKIRALDLGIQIFQDSLVFLMGHPLLYELGEPGLAGTIDENLLAQAFLEQSEASRHLVIKVPVVIAIEAVLR